VKSIKHNYTFYPKHLLWLLLASFILIGKTSYAQEKKLLWEISNDDSVVYLVGTVHVLEWHDYPLDILYEEAYRVADRVVFEVDLSSFGPEDAENFIQQNGLYPQGQTIRSHVSNKTYNLLREAAQAQGVDFNEVAKIKPWVWAVVFIDAMIQQSGLDPELGVDQHFSDKAAQDNKEIMELETWIDQLKIFSDAPLDKQGKYLDEIVNDLESNSIGDDEAAVDAWRDSDLSQLDALVEEMREEDDYAYGRLIKDRNNKWVPKIINYLNTPGTTTVFAGAAHFAGKDSVVKLLDKINYKATRLPSPPRLLDSPTNQTLNEGSSLTLSSQFRSLSTVSYIWFHNGRTLDGENDPTLEINLISEENAGSYMLKATNEAGSTTTTAVELRVIQKPKPPEIIQQPQDLIIGLGKEATFSINGQGTEPLDYQWYKDGKQIAGATSEVYRIWEVSENDFGSYSVTVKNEEGKAISQIAELKQAFTPKIIQQPQSRYVLLGDTVELNVKASGSDPLSYQWYREALPVNGANRSTYQILNIKESELGSYSIKVKNFVGTASSQIAVLKQAEIPNIIIHPSSQHLDLGNKAEFVVKATGTKPLDYLWYKNGKSIDGSNSPFLTLNNITKEDETIYSVRVKNDFGKAISEIASLTVITDPPTITTQPSDIETGLGEYAEFSVAVKGNEPFDYQWYKNGKIIEGGNKATLAIPSVSGDDITIYSVRIKNQFGKAISRIAELKLKKPEITLRPPTVDASGKLVLIANGPPNRKVIFQFSNDLMKWNDQLTLPLSDGTTTFNVPIQSSPNAPNLFYRLKLVE